MIKYLLKNKVFLLIIVLFFVLFPSNLSKTAQSQEEVIVVAVGVDKVDEELDISLQYLIPTPESQFKQQLKVVTMKDKNFSVALDKHVMLLGKHLGFSHCKAIVFSDSLKDENIINILDYIARTKINTYDISIINTPESAKDLLVANSNLDENFTLGLKTQNEFGDIRLYGSGLNLGKFYDEYLSGAKCSVAASIDLVKKSEVEGDVGSAGGSGEGASSSNQQSSDKIPVEKGNTIVLKEGKPVCKLSLEETRGFTFFDQKSNVGVLAFENVDDDVYKNADVMVQILKKKNEYDLKFENGFPVCEMDLTLYVRVIEITQDKISKNEVESQGTTISEELKNRIKQKVREYLQTSIEISKEKDFDIIGVYDKFNKYKNKEFEEYLIGLKENAYYLDQIDFKFNINIKPVL